MSTTKKYAPINVCIYCGATNKILTDEHIIPYGLNSASILPKASCLDCNKITSRIENSILRGFTWQMRTAFGFPTRRPKKVPKTFKLGIVRNGVESIIDVPVKNHLIVLPLPIFSLPTIFENKVLNRNKEFEAGIRLEKTQVIWFAEPEKIIKKYNADQIFVVQKVSHKSFAEMLAKIAYCYAVAEFGLDAFDEVYVLPAIRGERDDIGKWVGSSEQVFSAESNIGHQMQATIYEKPDDFGDSMIVVLLRLFANIPSPGYIIIVGCPKQSVL